MEALARSAVPASGSVQRAQAELAIREVTDQATAGLERPWRDAVRDAATGRPAGTGQDDDIVDALDAAVHTTSVDVHRAAPWWKAVQVVQWVLLLAAVVGLVWLVVEGVASVASFDVPDLGSVGPVPLTAVVAVGALVAGVVLAAVSDLAARSGGRRRAEGADQALRGAIDTVARDRIVAPIERELAVYETYRSGIATALR